MGTTVFHILEEKGDSFWVEEDGEEEGAEGATFSWVVEAFSWEEEVFSSEEEIFSWVEEIFSWEAETFS